MGRGGKDGKTAPRRGGGNCELCQGGSFFISIVFLIFFLIYFFIMN